MRRNPLTLPALLGAFYIYLLARSMGRGLGALLAGLRYHRILTYYVLPGFYVLPLNPTAPPHELGFVLLAGPLTALATGYLILVLVARTIRSLPFGLRLLLCFVSYLGLVLDPVYYAIIPLLRLGGEPELSARLTGASTLTIALPAMAILGLNVMLARRYLVPALKEQRQP
jgi:hypothetical protein